ncbi:rod shape-determining protein MreC [Novosphingobium umbonatum]|uniref:Cell shape-determining protein MreC n=1 Tax=Novosphingobium umbonatum TaxID=1908524 RepID=A0A3S2X5G0_9SPHN|nr:rod shape-determining protein MreC [Novosphingobium umbonatum]RVU06204.1 rod shape-determining protein MreC [Novosphingobium umbonatum]
MVPPGNRRSTYSRRALNNIFFGYVAAGAILLGGGGLALASYASPESFGGLRVLASDMVQPVAKLAAQGRAGLGQTFANLQAYATWGPENERLKREVAIGRVKAVELAAAQQENKRLQAMLQLGEVSPKPIAYGWLVASSSGSTRRYATISVGSNQGVQTGMPVRTAMGLIGRVLEVGRISARVLMITDAQSVVPVRRASDGLPAFATGKGDGTLQLRLLTLGINPLKPGDAFVTSGSGGLYWPDTPIAVVSSLTRDGAIARVLGDPAVSETVAVYPAWSPTQDATLPPPAEDVTPPKPAAKAKAQ